MHRNTVSETFLTLEVQKLKGGLWDACCSQTISKLLFVKLPFLGCGIARGVQENLGLETTAVEDGKLSRWWWRMPLDSRQLDTVLADRLDPDVLDVRFDVRVEIDGALEFVQELALYVVFVDDAFTSLVHSDDARTVSCNLSNAEREVNEEILGIFVKSTEVRAGHVRRAPRLHQFFFRWYTRAFLLDEMARNECTS